MPRKSAQPVLKHVVLSWRPPDKDAWRSEQLTVTSFNINAGVLSLFFKGQLLRILAPGLWGDVVVIGEELVTD